MSAEQTQRWLAVAFVWGALLLTFVLIGAGTGCLVAGGSPPVGFGLQGAGLGALFVLVVLAVLSGDRS